MLTVGQIETTGQQFRLGRMIIDATCLTRREQMSQSLKIILLIKMKQNFAIVWVADSGARLGITCHRRLDQQHTATEPMEKYAQQQLFPLAHNKLGLLLADSI